MDLIAIMAGAGIVIQILISLILFVKTWGSVTEQIKGQDTRLDELSISLERCKTDLEELETDEKESLESLRESLNDLRQEIMTALTRIDTGLTGMDGTNGIAGRLSELSKTVGSLEKQVTIIQTTLNNIK